MTPFTYDDALNEALANPEFKRVWEVNTVKREITKAIICERIKRKLTQAQLATKAGLKQPSVARVESGNMPSITTLNKIAKALGTRLEIRFV